MFKARDREIEREPSHSTGHSPIQFPTAFLRYSIATMITIFFVVHLHFCVFYWLSYITIISLDSCLSYITIFLYFTGRIVTQRFLITRACMRVTMFGSSPGSLGTTVSHTLVVCTFANTLHVVAHLHYFIDLKTIFSGSSLFLFPTILNPNIIYISFQLPQPPLISFCIFILQSLNDVFCET